MDRLRARGTDVLGHLRTLFAAATAAAAGALLLHLPEMSAPGERQIAVCSAVALAGWAVLVLRTGNRAWPLDVVALVPLVAVGTVLPDRLYLFPLLLVVVCQRALSVGRRRAYLGALVLFAAWETVRTGAGDDLHLGTAASVAGLLVGATALLRSIRLLAERADRTVRRERLLLRSVQTLVGSSEPRAILQEVARAGVALAESAGAACVVWEEHGGTWHVAAAEGPIRTDTVPSTVLPGEVLHQFELGVPGIIDGAVARELQVSTGTTPRYVAYVLVPLRRESGVRTAAMVYCEQVPDEDLLEHLRRYAIEVELAEGRVGLVAKLAAREARLSSIIHRSSDVIATLDADGRITMVNRSAEVRFGHRQQDALGRSVFSLTHPDDREIISEAMRRLRTSDSVHIACRLTTAEGEWRDVDCHLSRHDHGGYVLNVRDVTDRKALEAEIVHRAFHDPLTGLANRALFADRLRHALERARRTDDDVALLLIDLDDFKPVNDTHGHQTGDALLVAVAERLRREVRDSDTAARLGGDEFAVIVEDLGDELAVEAFADRLHRALSSPVEVAGTAVVVGVSIGVASAAGSATPESLIRRADEALYAAKRAGKGQVAGDPPSPLSTSVGA